MCSNYKAVMAAKLKVLRGRTKKMSPESLEQGEHRLAQQSGNFLSSMSETMPPKLLVMLPMPTHKFDGCLSGSKI
jgi:hypothetical protein